ncbi:two-component system sensor histidine kinase QseC [Ursidibacter maritimus]|uniref:Sensor protein QseC n=1 Tax=Ursidibacter maritimus TaxID=1331689 RepID=A0A949WGJ9_9PAST|nr:quorum sensing histidine kinase QseC [Ursidibacter maritimus]KAE9542242.1 two-component system sensor histidine kinase QseC [Ursidibacter maritimus]MBV6524518.1 two-component system sensor histidine kinase QseC [Ursidibacter maritimus]MBV6526243.1 two-component system sensor histidine kinase QseC [Ursidibacter maritimus]MBV6528322.1 two-component system sensor histidine kinase QseC [Ursidibacter maritimus]MBV6529638.1 two-component system sensor histidine kinase QseC [Ursidibacter maritimus
MKLIKNASLRLRLIIVISLTASFIWLISTVVAWLQVRKEVNQVFDAQQILFAQRLASSDLRAMLIERPHPKEKYHKKGGFRADFDDDALAFAVFTSQGDMLLSDGRNGDNFLYSREQGFTRSHLSSDDDEWRIFWLPIGDGKLVIAVGQELDYREDLILKMVFGQMWIWFASLPLLIALVIWLISRELRTLKQVSEQVRQRTPEDQAVISTENLPKEILPLVNNLNHFFSKTSTMLLRERRFTSDAAHELRSPLAALKIQTEIAQLAGDDSELREKALDNLTKGINRATQLIEQLLTLSRLDNLQALEGVEDIHWEKLLPSLIGELYFHAEKRQMELQFEQLATPMLKQGQPLLLSLMVRNLIDNAIKYCPESTIIRVTLAKHKLIIADNGGGVDSTDLAKLGQRFYRPAGQNEKGSGLGLSIVHRIAELHQYQVNLENSVLEKKQGLKVTISW